MPFLTRVLSSLVVALMTLDTAHAQVAITPTNVRPSAWERIALRVVNQGDNPINAVRVLVPDAAQVLGVAPYPGWRFTLERATDSTPQTIVWRSEAGLTQWEFREFAFYARIQPDVRQRQLIFPVELTRADGTIRRWSREDGSDAPPPAIQIAGTTSISNWGAFAVAAGAMALSILAIALAKSKGASAGGGGTTHRS